MQKKLKNILVDLGLLVIVFFIMFLFHAVFIAGPLRAQEYEQELFVDAFTQLYDLENIKIMNRFALDEIYYVVRDDTSLYAFNGAYTKVYKENYVSLDKVYSLASELGFNKSQVKYGVFGDTIVFSLEKSDRIVMVDMDNLEIVFE
jgi:hypothetical protein